MTPAFVPIVAGLRFPPGTPESGVQLIAIIAGMIAIAIFLLAVLLSWLLILLSMSGITKWPRVSGHRGPFIYFGFSLAVSCAVILLAMKLRIVPSESDAWTTGVWSTLIASVLGAVGAAFNRFVGNKPQAKLTRPTKKKE
jgi:uncharacterized BrkB/YihY/UPF0761 family membrane protein